MPKGEHLKGKGGKKFTNEYQPSPEAKSAGKVKLSTFREALDFISTKIKHKEIDIDGQELEMTAETKALINLIKDTDHENPMVRHKAIEICTKIFPNWLQAKTINVKTDFGASPMDEQIIE
jgi:hypothetical protein